MEYLRMSNHKTALAHFEESQRLNSEDPLVYNEIGVVHFNEKRFKDARDTLATGLSLCSDVGEEQASNSQHIILLNLAHCHRKLG
jgi:anaphase-promoting complex subunit 6